MLSSSSSHKPDMESKPQAPKFRSFPSLAFYLTITFLLSMDTPTLPEDLDFLWESPKEQEKFWTSLTPWFASRGYALYRWIPVAEAEPGKTETYHVPKDWESSPTQTSPTQPLPGEFSCQGYDTIKISIATPNKVSGRSFSGSQRGSPWCDDQTNSTGL